MDTITVGQPRIEKGIASSKPQNGHISGVITSNFQVSTPRRSAAPLVLRPGTRSESSVVVQPVLAISQAENAGSIFVVRSNPESSAE